jgi:hypothetical protein
MEQMIKSVKTWLWKARLNAEGDAWKGRLHRGKKIIVGLGLHKELRRAFRTAPP